MSLMGLLGDYGSDSDASSDDSDQDVNTKEVAVKKCEPLPPPVIERLDNPFGGGGGKGGSLIPKPSFQQEQHTSVKVNKLDFDSGTSVFRNPFRDKEDKKKAILEQHVNMTQRQEELKMIDGKKVCWMYRKGRCRNGSKCKFAHDSDVKAENLPARPEEVYDSDAQISSYKSRSGLVQALNVHRELSPIPQEDEAQAPRKRRPGVTDNIHPSKKAMDFHKRVYKTA